MALQKRKFEVTVTVDEATKAGALRKDMRNGIATAIGTEKVVLKPLGAVTKAKKAVAKKPARRRAA